MKLLRKHLGAFAALLLAVAPLAGQGQDQDTGQIVGRVVDAALARPLSNAQVYVNDGVVGSLTDMDGRYVIGSAPACTVSVTVQLIGYATKAVTDVVVTPERVTVLDLTVEENAVELEGIVVAAERERDTQVFPLDARRTAPSLVEAVGAVEISRRPDSDAADVAPRLTVSEGKYGFVRGLGERDSQTSLNGSSLPSPEPEREVVPLDPFPSGFLQSLRTQKSYTPDLPADFSGGSVKIEKRDFPNETTVRLGLGQASTPTASSRTDTLPTPEGAVTGLDSTTARVTSPASSTRSWVT